MKTIHWLEQPEEHDYPAAASYLSLIYRDDYVKEYIADLKIVEVVEFKAKDIFRASGLSLLGVSNSHVKKNTKKIEEGVKFSPLLLVRSALNGKVVVADGYHRLCAIYAYNEDSLIKCKIVD